MVKSSDWQLGLTWAVFAPLSRLSLFLFHLLLATRDNGLCLYLHFYALAVSCVNEVTCSFAVASFAASSDTSWKEKGLDKNNGGSTLRVLLRYVRMRVVVKISCLFFLNPYCETCSCFSPLISGCAVAK